jgi:hypothetical protein
VQGHEGDLRFRAAQLADQIRPDVNCHHVVAQSLERVLDASA